MADSKERRAVARTMLSEPSAVHVDGVREVHLRDLSLTGAQIEHSGDSS